MLIYPCFISHYLRETHNSILAQDAFSPVKRYNTMRLERESTLRGLLVLDVPRNTQRFGNPLGFRCGACEFLPYTALPAAETRTTFAPRRWRYRPACVSPYVISY
jgi:hypothetical protein